MTSQQPSERTQVEHLKWGELIAELPARWRAALSGSAARLVRFRGGYVIDVDIQDDEAFASTCENDPSFRGELMKLVTPWGLDHPLVKGRHNLRGIVFGSNLPAPSALKELGCELTNFTPRRWPCKNT